MAGIVISVPHATCRPVATEEFSRVQGRFLPVTRIEEKICDSISKYVGMGLHNKLKKELVKPNGNFCTALTIFESDPMIDQNKPEQRNSRFRQNLRQLITIYGTILKDQLIHFDIHSFDPSKNPDWSDAGVVFIEDMPLRDDLDSVGLSHFLSSKEIKTKVVQSSGNDILDEMNELNVASILVEINESLDREQQDFIINSIYEWIISPEGQYSAPGGGRNGIHYGAGSGLLFGLGAGIGGVLGFGLAGPIGALGGAALDP